MIRTYRKLSRIKSFEERYLYLQLGGVIGETTFGFDRVLNQVLYHSDKWKRTRDEIIIRDDGCDLGIEDYPIDHIILVHHMNSITLEDIEMERDILFDPDNLICTSRRTHNAIHYGDINLLPKPLIERRRFDTCPWR